MRKVIHRHTLHSTGNPTIIRPKSNLTRYRRQGLRRRRTLSINRVNRSSRSKSRILDCHSRNLVSPQLLQYRPDSDLPHLISRHPRPRDRRLEYLRK